MHKANKHALKLSLAHKCCYFRVLRPQIAVTTIRATLSKGRAITSISLTAAEAEEGGGGGAGGGRGGGGKSGCTQSQTHGLAEGGGGGVATHRT